MVADRAYSPGFFASTDPGASPFDLAADDAEGQARLVAFLQGLQEAGWAVGRNLRIDLRWGAGDAEHFRKQAAELAALTPDVLFASGIPAAPPLLQATRTVPIVFA